MAKTFRILGIAGSLRKESYNKALLRAALEVLPKGVELDVFDLDGIPGFNQDLEQLPPPKIRDLKSKVRAADGILIATPEYNYSMPGVLKNAIDWASRPYGDNAFDDKPVAIMGASIGMIGTARAQYHLRQSCVFLNMHPVNQPEVMVSFAQERIRDGVLTDQTSRDLIKQLIESLVMGISPGARHDKTRGNAEKGRLADPLCKQEQNSLLYATIDGKAQAAGLRTCPLLDGLWEVSVRGLHRCEGGKDERSIDFGGSLSGSGSLCGDGSRCRRR